jgi:alpha-beta hydrolase superfamily lysophospholipase
MLFIKNIYVCQAMKNKIIEIVLKIVKVSLILYILICWLLYFLQEKIIFFPAKLDTKYTFLFQQDFKEINIITDDNISLHGILFPAENSKWLIFYLHGNAWSVKSWWNVAQSYTQLGYDIFILDYRWYGKSSGSISSEKQLFQDVQVAYNEMLKSYNEKDIIILWYSVGTGIAAKTAAENNPKMLILQAPYYSMLDMMRHNYPFVPNFLLKYKLQTNLLIPKIHAPIVLFHGEQDKVVYYDSSLKLQKLLKKWDTFISLENQWHNWMTYNVDYLEKIKQILNPN